MACSGDLTYQPKVWCPCIRRIPSMSAFCIESTPFGIVVASDSRKTMDDGDVVENVQKIIPVETDACIACVGLVDWDEDGMKFSYLESAIDIMRTETETVETMADQLFHRAESLYKPEFVVESFDADVYLVRLFRESPDCHRINFTRDHATRTLLRPNIYSVPAIRQGLEEINSWEPCRFARYYPLHTLHENQSLNEAARLAFAYISACCGPEAQAVNPTGARSIGLPVQMATITPAEGFQWISGHSGAMLNR